VGDTSVPKHVEFDTCHELYFMISIFFFVFYWGHFLVDILRINLFRNSQIK
jgi:hypothetical protein